MHGEHVMDERLAGAPVEPNYVCPHFQRAPESLIEEPEVCENCGSYEDGFCLRREEPLCETTR